MFYCLAEVDYNSTVIFISLCFQ